MNSEKRIFDQKFKLFQLLSGRLKQDLVYPYLVTYPRLLATLRRKSVYRSASSLSFVSLCKVLSLMFFENVSEVKQSYNFKNLTQAQMILCFKQAGINERN